MATINYDWPVASPGTTPPASTTPPPTITTSSVRYNTVVAQLIGDGLGPLTTITITHNLQLTTAELAAQQPEVAVEYLVPAIAGQCIYVVSKGTNTVVLGCAVTMTAATTYATIRIRRPFAPTR